MAKSRIFTPRLPILTVTAIFISGCVYLTHFHEAMFVKNLEDNRKEMQVQLDEEAKLYNNLRADITNGRLAKLTQKQAIFHLYGEPSLCRPAEGLAGSKETCIYRKPSGGLFTEIILLNFDARDRLNSCQIQNPKE
ncbi:MAG: hypothetical protein PHC71_02620 [Candidatus Omnitrophica bacterium]|nr:hypothetical protein [Candidatus Omnitrophota bacterium]